jgi:hypothetical protein
MAQNTLVFDKRCLQAIFLTSVCADDQPKKRLRYFLSIVMATSITETPPMQPSTARTQTIMRQAGIKTRTLLSLRLELSSRASAGDAVPMWQLLKIEPHHAARDPRGSWGGLFQL